MIKKLPILIVLILFFFGSFVGSTVTTVATAGEEGLWAWAQDYPNPFFEDDAIWVLDQQCNEYPNPFVVQDSVTLNTESSFYTSQVVNTSANTSANTYRSTDGMEVLTATCEWSMTMPPNQFATCEDVELVYLTDGMPVKARPPNQSLISLLGCREDSDVHLTEVKWKWQAQKFTLPGTGLTLRIDGRNGWYGFDG